MLTQADMQRAFAAAEQKTEQWEADFQGQFNSRTIDSPAPAAGALPHSPQVGINHDAFDEDLAAALRSIEHFAGKMHLNLTDIRLVRRDSSGEMYYEVQSATGQDLGSLHLTTGQVEAYATYRGARAWLPARTEVNHGAGVSDPRPILPLRTVAGGVRPPWWPKQRATILRWKWLYRQIKPMHELKLNRSKIAAALTERGQKISRELVGHILDWMSLDSDAHT